MILGDLTKTLEFENSIYDSVNENRVSYKKPSRLSTALTKLSHYGMSYEEDIYKNMTAVPANKNFANKEDTTLSTLYGNSLYLPNWRPKNDAERPFREKTLDQRRLTLRKLAGEPELEDILDIMTDESIVYDDDQAYICQPYIDTAVTQMLNEQAAEEIRNSVNTAFYKIYMLEDLKNQAWNIYKRYLIDGNLAFEIVYDNLENPKYIKGIIELDPATLTKEWNNGRLTWIQYKGVMNAERTLDDTQVIFIQYDDSGVLDRTSYLERLIRPFNIYRIIEQAQVIWTVTQSSFKTMFTIPIGGMNRAKGMQTLNSAMNRYREDITFNNETGELKVNGQTNLPFNKEYWLPEGENGKPTIETLYDQSPSLNDSEQLKYFLSKLYKISKIPEGRFDTEAQTTWFGSDPTSQMRDEITFSRFITRVRNAWAQLILKPLKIQVALSMPELKNDKRVLEAIGLSFNSYNLFEEMMEIEIDSKRIEFISNMSQSLVTTDAEGNEAPFFSMKYLIMKHLKVSDADLELNEKFKLEEKQASKNLEDAAEEEEGGSDVENDESEDMLSGGEEEQGGPEETSGAEPDEGPEIDSEMMGDVQPESPETTQA